MKSFVPHIWCPSLPGKDNNVDIIKPQSKDNNNNNDDNNIMFQTHSKYVTFNTTHMNTHEHTCYD